MRRPQKHLLTALAIVSVTTTCTRGGCGAPRPRLVVIALVDALRADHLGCYGSTRGLTPELDRLAARSFVFRQVSATSAWTKSSVASLFTARYPSALGVLGRADAMSGEELTLAEVLRARGWRTVGVTTNDNAGEAFGFTQGFDDFEMAPGGHGAHEVTGAALRILDEHRLQGDGRPLFLFLHYVDPHEPYVAHPGLLAEAEPGGRFDGRLVNLAAADRLPRSELTREDRARIEYLYAAEVRFADAGIGRLVEGLRSRGLLKRTMVVLTADHGEGLWDHGERAHGHELYQEQIHVPLLVHYPRMTPRESRHIETPASNVDIAPTILGALRIEPPEAFQGDDLAPLTRGERQQRRVAPAGIYSELGLDQRNMDAIREGRMKLIRHRKGSLPETNRRLELYDLEADARESVDLARERPSEVRRLAARLREWRAFLEKTSRGTTKVDETQLPERVRDNLRALGYLQ